MNTKHQPASLERITFVNLSAGLFKLAHVQKQLCSLFWVTDSHNDCSGSYSKKLKEINKNVTHIIQKAEYPSHLREEILRTVKIMVTQVVKWMTYHQKMLSRFHAVPELCLNSLFWSSQCLINKKATAELLVKEQQLDVRVRFKLSCIYCLEVDIPILWKEIQETFKIHIPTLETELEKFWSYSLSGNLNDKNIDDFNEVGFMEAVVKHNEVAAIYFWQKLLPEKKDKILNNATEITSLLWNRRFHSSKYLLEINEYYADILYFLLSQMNDVQQANFLQEDVRLNKHCLVLSPFLAWNHQDHFIPIANHMWKFLPMDDYFNLIFEIGHKIASGEKDYDYRRLLKEFWQNSPNEYRRLFLISYGNQFISEYFRTARNFECEDVALVVMILKDVTSEEKAIYNFDSYGKDLCCRLIKDHRWKLVEVLINNCFSSEEQKREFKKSVIRSINEGSWLTDYILQKKWEELELLISFLLSKDASASEMSKYVFATYRYNVISKLFWWCLSSVKDIGDLFGDYKYKEFIFKNVFDVIECFVISCFITRQKFIEFKKQMIYHITQIYKHEILTEIITNNRLGVIQNFVSWCLLTEVEIQAYKKYLSKFSCKDLIHQNGFKSIKKFIIWCFDDDEERNVFKKAFIYSKKDECQFHDFMYEGKMEVMDAFISWCLPPGERKQFKKDLIYSMKNKSRFHSFIYEDKLDEIGIFISWCLADDDIYEFKKILFHEMRTDLRIKNLMSDESLYLLKKFMKWCSSSEELDTLKETMMYSIKTRHCFKNFIYKNDFDWIKQMITWSFSSNWAKKKFMLDLIHSIKMDLEFYSLIAEDKITLLNGFISWCLVSEDEIVKFKKELIFSLKEMNRFKFLILGNKFDIIQKFITWGLSSEEDVTKFKTQLMYSMKDDDDLHNFMYGNKLILIERFIAWCSSDELHVSKFKKEMLYSLRDDYEFNKLISNDNFDLAEKIITWCLSTEDEITIFKQEVMDSMKDKGFPPNFLHPSKEIEK